MIPLSDLLSQEVKEAETKAIVVELKLDDDDFSSSNRIGVDNILIRMLMSGIVSAIMMMMI